MSKIFFTSDLHFSHKNITKLCPKFRPATDCTDELDEYMIEAWNNTVSPEDTVYNLGDVSFAHNIGKIENTLGRLNGKHHLIFGNHDTLIERHKRHLLNTLKHDGNPLLSSAQHYLKFKLPEISNTLILFHYPIYEWDGCHKGWYHLYGHLHNRTASVPGRLMNVGWDLHGRFLTPADIDALLKDLPEMVYFENQK